MKRIIYIALFCFLAFVRAQELSLEPTTLYPSPGDNISILLYLDLEDFINEDGMQQEFSNYDCLMSYSSEVLSNPQVDDGDSFINNFSSLSNTNTPGQINFLSYSTSGYTGDGGLLASINFIVNESAQDGNTAEIIVNEFYVNEILYTPTENSITLTVNCPPDIDDDCDGVLNTDEIVGCLDEEACNYNAEATDHDIELCEYAEENLDCDGNCVLEVDCMGMCGGTSVVDECDECLDGTQSNDYECVLGCDGIYYNDGTGPEQSECDECPWWDECAICEGDGIPDGACDCDPSVDCAPVINSVTDVPNDQGGWVHVNFYKSHADNDSPELSRDIEMYTVQRYDSDSDNWINLASGSAYGEDEYFYEVHTSINASNVSDGMLDYRVIASMDEGIWISEIESGYSVDNLAPYTPSDIVVSYSDDSALISWEESSDNDFYGYIVYNAEDVNFIPSESNISNFQSENFFLKNNIDIDSYYRISAVDHNGNESPYSELITIESELSNQLENSIPAKDILHNNFPNPFNPVTNIHYDINTASYVKIVLHDYKGRYLKELFNGVRIGGSYTYTLAMDAYSSGVYIVNMYVDSKLIDSQKILYIK